MKIPLGLILSSWVLLLATVAGLGSQRCCAGEAEAKPETEEERYKRFREGEKPAEGQAPKPAEGTAAPATPAAEAKPAEGTAAPAAEAKPAETAAAAEGEQPKPEAKREDPDEPELVDLYHDAEKKDEPTNGRLGGELGRAAWKKNKVPRWAIDQEPLLPVGNRWGIGFPHSPRHVTNNAWHNPYRQNVLKGDYPILGQDKFLVINAGSDTTAEFREIPTPSGNTPFRPGSFDFFGSPEATFVQQNFFLSVEFFGGETAFKPRAWEARVTPVFNINYINTDERLAVNIDSREGRDRLDHQIAFQELFGEYHFVDISPNYDFIAGRAGIQFYNHDFRGFLFADNQLGARLFGTYENNRLQYNFTYWEMLNKDTNSGLNTLFQMKDEHVFLANLIRQDTFVKGYNIIGQVGLSVEEASVEFNQNGVPVRPTPIGSGQPHSNKVGYVGFGGNGHIGRFNLSHQYYLAYGEDTLNPIAGQQTDILAHMFAAELSYDWDWMRFRTSYFYSSGDEDPEDDKAEGFDSIFENPEFAGGQFSYWVRQGFGAGNTFTLLKSRNSLIPNLSAGKEEGQANFVNPGVHLFNIGYDAELTPSLRAVANINYLKFADTTSLEFLLGQEAISKEIGLDYSLGLIYRPLLNQQIILTGGVAALQPFDGYKKIYDTSGVQLSGFMNVIVKY
ncbi:MAG: hypothetical protein HS116_16450 [Planctomycetes bacterium]|nr:hypothetical protein [Planctomycetota bacterium]